MQGEDQTKPGFYAPPEAPRPALQAAPAQTAADHLVVRVLRADPEQTVAGFRTRLASGVEPLDSAEAVWLVDSHKRLVGWVPLPRLLTADASLTLGQLASPAGPAVEMGADQEAVASLALGHQLNAVPVLDSQGHFAGVVPAQALLDILRREHVEDLHRLAGIGPETELAREALEAPPLRRVRHRLPWLLIGLVGSLLTALIVASFEASLEARIAVAYFIPAIVYLADAVGTQSEAIAIRSLSLSRKPLRRLLAGEMRTGLLIGLTLALLALFPIWWWFGDARLALAVAIALLAATACATTIGFSLPWILARTGRDPAFGSGPLATIAQDLLSLLIYFWVVSLLLG
jgi:magnesium transporter